MNVPIQNVKKIAVLRANALGDFIFALPALTALRETYADAEISLLGRPWHTKLLKNRKSPVDRVIEIPRSEGVYDVMPYDSSKILADFFDAMCEEKFDIAIQLHGGGKYSNPFINNLGASLTIGTKTPDADSPDLWIPYIYYHREILRWLELVSLIGAKTEHISPILAVTPEDISEAKHALGDTEKPFIIIHPGASDPRRRWPAEKFAQVADSLSAQNYRIIVTGSADEKEVVEKVLANMKYPADNFYEKVSINGLIGLISLAQLIISNDTGPFHVAEAVGTKSIGLFWCGNGINGAPMTRTLHRSLFSWIVRCPLCKQHIAKNTAFERKENGCQHLASFIDDIDVYEVLFQANDLLKNLPKNNTLQSVQKEVFLDK